MNSTIHKETQTTIALRQTKDKLFQNSHVFIGLVILQMVGYLISFQVMSGGFETEYFHFFLRGLNPFILYFFTILWIYFSDIAVLEIYALVGGLAIFLSLSILQVMAATFYPSSILHPAFTEMGWIKQVRFFISAFFYFLICGAGAYTVGIFRARYVFRFFLGVLLTITGESNPLICAATAHSISML